MKTSCSWGFWKSWRMCCFYWKDFYLITSRVCSASTRTQVTPCVSPLPWRVRSKAFWPWQRLGRWRYAVISCVPGLSKTEEKQELLTAKPPALRRNSASPASGSMAVSLSLNPEVSYILRRLTQAYCWGERKLWGHARAHWSPWVQTGVGDEPLELRLFCPSASPRACEILAVD